MPVAQPTVKRNPIPPGDHILSLVSVTETEQPSFRNPKELAVRWIWQFKAQMRDEETGERYEYREYTGPNYGNPKANLTILLDQVLPNASEEERATVDTDALIGKAFKAKIRHEKPEKAGDPPTPRLAFIEPYKTQKATAKPAPVEEELDDEPDPFEE